MKQETIRYKLDQIDALYPPERLAASKDRWTRLWRGDAPLDRTPFVFGTFRFGYYVAGLTPEECLHAQLDEIIIRGQFHDDFIPTFFPGCRTATIPSLFGAEEVIVDGDFSCRQLIERAEDIDRLPEPAITPGTVAYDWLVMQQYVLEATEGRLPVHVTDMQGPADVCGKLWGYDAFLSCAYEDPARYHQLMSRITDAFILYWEAQRRLCGDLFVGTHLYAWDWVPLDNGATVSADSLVMISPAYYREFYQPYLQRIGEAFGGLSVHSCGDFSAVVPALCATPTVKAVNAGQMTLPTLLRAGLDACTIASVWASPWTSPDVLEETFTLLHAHHLRVSLTVSGLWPTRPGGMKPAQEWTQEDRDAMTRHEERVIRLATIR